MKFYLIRKRCATIDSPSKLIKCMIFFIIFQFAVNRSFAIPANQPHTLFCIRAANRQELVEVSNTKANRIHMGKNGRAGLSKLEYYTILKLISGNYLRLGGPLRLVL